MLIILESSLLALSFTILTELTKCWLIRKVDQINQLNNMLTDPLRSASSLFNRTVVDEEDSLTDMDLITEGKSFF